MKKFPDTFPAVYSDTMSREELDHYWALALDIIEDEGAIHLIREGAKVVRMMDKAAYLEVLMDVCVHEGSALSRQHAMLLKTIDFFRQRKMPVREMH